MEQAIKKAIEGGWNPHKMKSFDGLECLEFSEVREDPDFWKCLGKALGWREEEWHPTRKYPDGEAQLWPGYMKYWHSFIDHLAEDGDAESFFNSLLK